MPHSLVFVSATCIMMTNMSTNVTSLWRACQTGPEHSGLGQPFRNISAGEIEVFPNLVAAC